VFFCNLLHSNLSQFTDLLRPIRDRRSRTLLQLAVKSGKRFAVEMLLELGGAADVDAPNESGTTALHMAAKRNHLKILKLLLRYGADAHKVDNYGNNALHIAARRHGNFDVVRHLVSQCHVDIERPNDGELRRGSVCGVSDLSHVANDHCTFL
jgi:ankyrin repeat protein